MANKAKKTKKIKDTDYLSISTSIRAMENHLLSRERMEQILDAHSNEEATKLLQECGYPELDPQHPEAMDAALSQVREETLENLLGNAPDSRYIEIFKLKYDYHNVKAILKAEAMHTDPKRMLLDLGRIAPDNLIEIMHSEDMRELPGRLPEAVKEAREVLETTRDPQLCDIALDRWSYKDMMDVADATGSAFLRGYVRVQIDATNLRSLVRTLRMKKTADFLRGVLIEGGDIEPDAVLRVSENNGVGMSDVYNLGLLQRAAESGAQAIKGGLLTEFEKLCDDAINDYLAGAHFVPFGEAPLLGYLAARETEYTNIRILLLGRVSGLPADVIRSRLRAGYV